MPNLVALRGFINGLQGDRLFIAGIVGATSQLQYQTEELKKAFGGLQADSQSKKASDNFKSVLFACHAMSVITDKELAQCEDWLEE